MTDPKTPDRTPEPNPDHADTAKRTPQDAPRPDRSDAPKDSPGNPQK